MNDRSCRRLMTVISWPTALALVLLCSSILVVELGWREPASSLAVAVPIPQVVAPTIEQLRSVPQRSINDPRVGAVVAGVVFGRADDVSVGDQQAFLDSGLWHLLAASGQNIALVSVMCIFFARMFGGGRTAGSVLAIFMIAIYVMLVGGGASIVRAGITGVLVIAAWLSGRIADARHVLIVAAAITCTVWPGAYRGLGMQLSYICVAALLLWAVGFTHWLQTQGIPKFIAAPVAVTLLCSMATAPILHLRTGSAPLVGIVANLVAVPTAGLLLMLGLTGSVASLIVEMLPGSTRSFSGLVMMPSSLLGSTLLAIAQRAANLPLASTTLPLINLGVPFLALIFYMTKALDAWRAHRQRILVVSCTLVAAVQLGTYMHIPRLASASSRPPDAGILRVSMLDVGQGDATLLSLDGHSVLVDTGPPMGRVVSRVRDAGVEQLDALVLTHDSLDHRGGFDQAREVLKPAWTARPYSAPGPWKHIEHTAPKLVDVCAGDSFMLSTARVEVLHPRCDAVIVPRTGDLHNDGAMVLLITHGDIRILLPADAEAPVLTGLSIGRVDLLRVSHHGSSDPKLSQLLASISPRAAAISVGAGNSYGHPTKLTLHALRQAQVPVWRTDQDGTISFDSDGHSLSIVR